MGDPQESIQALALLTIGCGVGCTGVGMGLNHQPSLDQDKKKGEVIRK